MSLSPSLYRKLPYNPIKDFAPVSRVTNVPFILVAHPSIGVNNFQEFVALGRSKKRALNYGSAGSGNSTHLAMVLLEIMAKIELNHVPYKGTGPALTDLVAGHIHALWGTMPTTLPLITAGRLKGLAVGSLKRTKAIPELPTVAELGYPGYEAGSWFGILAPAGTPRPIVARLNKEVVEALARPELAERLSSEGAEPATNSPEQFAAFIKADVEKWAKIAEVAGVVRE